jgi:exopolysaccharide production protein ExoQ
MNKILIISEKIFAMAAFIHYSGGPLYLFLSNGFSEGEDLEPLSTYPLLNNVFLLVYLITFCLLALRWKKVVFVIRKNYLIWPLFGLAIASIFWSDSPDLTRTRVVALIGTMMFSLYLASRYSIKEQLRLYGWIFGAIIILSLLFVVLIPKYGVMASVHAGAWRGIFNHKNALGKVMVPIPIVFYILALNTQKQRWVFWMLLGTSVMLVVLSRASSSVINLLFVIGLFAILPVLRWKYLLMIPCLLGVASVTIVLYTILTSNAEQAAGAFGKDLTLTGRTNFWPLLVDKIVERPWLGYGYGAFWQGYDGPSAYVWNASAFKAPNSHNGYLDLLLELGFVGFAVYMTTFIYSFQKALLLFKHTKTAYAFWPILLLCYVVFCNLTESSLVLQNNFLWVMQLTIIFSISIPQLDIDKTDKLTTPVAIKSN